MSKINKRKTTIITVTVSLLLTAAIVASTFLFFRPYYYKNLYIAPAPKKLSVAAPQSTEPVFADFYVSVDGNDNASGTVDHPFATIKKAQDAMRMLNKDMRSHIVIAIKAGTYNLDSFILTKSDSGTEKCPIIYAAYGDGEVIFSCNSEKAAIEIKNAQYLTVSNITIENKAGNGISVSGKYIDIYGCTVRNTAGVGISATGNNINISHCHINKTGLSAATISGGNKKKLTEGNVIFDNNLIHSTSQKDSKQPAVIIDGVGNACTHNEIYNTPSCAVFYSGNLNKVEYNYIHNVLLNTDSSAAISTNPSLINYGNLIRYNCISMLGNGENKPVAIIPCSGTTVRGNMLINIPGTGVKAVGCRDLEISNNILLNCANSISFEPLINTQQNSAMLLELSNSAYKSEAWQEKLPVMAKLLTDSSAKSDPNFALTSAGSLIESNIVLHAEKSLGSFDKSTTNLNKIESNLLLNLYETDIFIDAKNGDYNIHRDNKQITEIGFNNLPFDSMGNY